MAALKDANVSSSLMLRVSVFQRAGAQTEKLRSPHLLLERATSSRCQGARLGLSHVLRAGPRGRQVPHHSSAP